MPDIPAIDVLFHSARVAAPSPAMSCEQALAMLNAAGVERAFVSQCNQWACERQPLCTDMRLEYVLRFTRRSPRFVGLAGYNPFDITESVREIEVAVSLGLRGVYLHAANFGLPLADARYYPVFAKASEMRVPVVVELGPAEPVLAATVRRLAKDVPELALALLQPRPDQALMQALAAECENLAFLLDAGGLAFLRRTAATSPGFFQSSAFAERCCWASNGAPLREAVAAARALPVPPETLAAFLARNAARLFALGEPAQPRTPQSLPGEVVVAET